MLTRAMRSSSSGRSVPAGRKVHFTTGRAALRRRWDTTQDSVMFWPSWATVKGEGVIVTLTAEHKSEEGRFASSYFTVYIWNKMWYEVVWICFMTDDLYHPITDYIQPSKIWKIYQRSGCRWCLNYTCAFETRLFSCFDCIFLYFCHSQDLLTYG